MDKLIKWAMEIQSLAQAGLEYTDDVYDIERYKRLREISAEIIEEKSNISLEKVKDLFCSEKGYQTPKWKELNYLKKYWKNIKLW